MEKEKKFLSGSKLGATAKSTISNKDGGTANAGQQGNNKQKPSDSPPKPDRNAEREKSSEEKLADVLIYPVERARLDKVFEKMSTAATNKPKEDKDFITAQDIAKILAELKFKITMSEIDLMIWVLSRIFILQSRKLMRISMEESQKKSSTLCLRGAFSMRLDSSQRIYSIWCSSSCTTLEIKVKSQKRTLLS